MDINQDDLLSSLPMNLLITILSLLPLKDAVRTSILSKQWNDLWRLRTNIEINERHFTPRDDENNDHPTNQGPSPRQIRQTSCIEFGCKWVQILDDPQNTISSFTLVFSDPMEHRIDVERFVHFAVKRKTKSIELDFSGLDWEDRLPIPSSDRTYATRFELPYLVYLHTTLESLKLVSCRFKPEWCGCLCNSLKTLSLGWIEIANASVFENLSYYCHFLESLTLFKCYRATEYVIKSGSLKTLVVDKCVDLLSLTLLTPYLINFKYCGDFVQFGMCSFKQLEKAYLDFGLAGFFDEEKGDNVIQLLKDLYIAKSLRVCAYVTQVLPMASDSSRLPGRPCAKELTIKTAFHGYEFSGILSLLESYPLLEKLCFEVGEQIIFEEDMAPFVYWDPETFWTESKPLVNGCVKKELKVVEIKGYRGTTNELRVLSFLLQHGHVLQKLVLKVAQDDEQARLSATYLRTTTMEQSNRINVVVVNA